MQGAEILNLEIDSKDDNALLNAGDGAIQRKKFNLDKLDKDRCHYDIYIPDTVLSVSPSYISELFQNSVNNILNYEEFHCKYTIIAKFSILRCIESEVGYLYEKKQINSAQKEKFQCIRFIITIALAAISIFCGLFMALSIIADKPIEAAEYFVFTVIFVMIYNVYERTWG